MKLGPELPKETTIEFVQTWFIAASWQSSRDKSFISQKTLKNTALYLLEYGRGLRTQINTKDEALLHVLEQASTASTVLKPNFLKWMRI